MVAVSLRHHFLSVLYSFNPWQIVTPSHTACTRMPQIFVIDLPSIDHMREFFHKRTFFGCGSYPIDIALLTDYKKGVIEFIPLCSLWSEVLRCIFVTLIFNSIHLLCTASLLAAFPDKFIAKKAGKFPAARWTRVFRPAQSLYARWFCMYGIRFLFVCQLILLLGEMPATAEFQHLQPKHPLSFRLFACTCKKYRFFYSFFI